MDRSLHDFVFHFNTYTNKWRTVHRDYYSELFSGGEHIIESSRITTLMDIINRTRGDISRAEELLNRQTIEDDD